MSQSLDHPAGTAPSPGGRGIPGGAWRLAGGLALLHVVLLVAGFSQEKSPVLTDGADVVQRTFVEADLARVLAGGYLESLAFVLLLPVLVFIARAIGRTEAGRWAAQTALVAGVCYVAVTLASGMAAGAAALYGAQHGVVDGATLALVTNVRNFAFYLSILVLGAHALGTGIAALIDGTMRRWVGWGGVVVGFLLLVGVALQGLVDGADYATLLWLVWWVGLALCLIRRGSAPA